MMEIDAQGLPEHEMGALIHNYIIDFLRQVPPVYQISFYLSQGLKLYLTYNIVSVE